MSSFNRVIIVGNLTRDPEMRVTPKGTAICQLGIATNRKFKTEGGDEREEVCFIDVEAWGKQAETISKYCTKGKQLLVEGRLKFDQWEDKTSGQKRSKLKVVLENFQFLGSKSDGANGNGGEHSEGHQADADDGGRGGARAPAGRTAAAPAGSIDDDVPFASIGASTL